MCHAGSAEIVFVPDCKWVFWAVSSKNETDYHREESFKKWFEDFLKFWKKAPVTMDNTSP